MMIRGNWEGLVNKIAVRKANRIILEYSARKIRAKLPPLYSTLNPETSSDSPSAKSKGERLVSARQMINHSISNGNIPIANHRYD